MTTAKNAVRISLLVLWIGILAGLTGIFSAIPLKVLRAQVGSLRFWIFGAVISASAWAVHFFPVAIIVAAQTVLIGVYSGLEEREATVRHSAFYAVSLTALLAGSGFYFWSSLFGKNWLTFVTGGLQTLLTEASKVNTELFSSLKAEDLLSQLPSAIVIFLIISVAIAAIFERPVAQLTRGQSIRRRQRLTDYSVPDGLIWIFILSLLGTFAHHDMPTVRVVSLNALNVCVVLFFFQGLAVMGRYFEVFKVSLFWRWAWVLLLAIQLPVLLGLIGIVDFWVDFRRLFVKRTTNLKNKRIEE